MRETGQHINRNPNALANRQVMCGIALDDYTITRIASNVFHNDKNTVYRFQLLYRFYRHVEYKLTRAVWEENNETELRNLRVKYLLGEITKPQWKRTLQQIDKKTKKTTVYNNIWRLIQTVMTSFMEQIITCSNENASPVEYLKIIEEAINFKVYANDSFCKACSVFGSTSCPGIDDSWREIYNYKKYLKNKNKS